MHKINHWPPVLGAGLTAVASALTLTAGPVAAAAPAAPVVHETLIDPGSPDSYAAAINNLGDVVGTDDSGAFLRDATGVHGLAPPAGVAAITPTAINDRGDILVQTAFAPDQVYLRRDGRGNFGAAGEGGGVGPRG